MRKPMHYRPLNSMMITLILILAGCSSHPNRQDYDKLETGLQTLLDSLDGETGLYVEHLSTGYHFGINADTVFPTASMIKVPILCAIFDKISQGKLQYDQELTWIADSIAYPYPGGILWSFQEGKTISLRQVISLMITYSDNHASLWCQKLAGTGIEINAWLNNNGFQHTRVNSRTKGRESDYQRYGWGQTTPREMAQLLTMIRNGKAVSPTAADEMYRILCNIYWNKEALSQIPPTVQAAAKQGAVSHSRSEVVLVNAPHGDYVVCVITKNQADKSWDRDNDGYVLIRKISQQLWDFFEPGLPYSPLNQDSWFD